LYRSLKKLNNVGIQDSLSGVQVVAVLEKWKRNFRMNWWVELGRGLIQAECYSRISTVPLSPLPKF